MRKEGVKNAQGVCGVSVRCSAPPLRISYTPLTRLRAGLAMRKGGVKNAGVLRADFSVFFFCEGVRSTDQREYFKLSRTTSGPVW